MFLLKKKPKTNGVRNCRGVNKFFFKKNKIKSNRSFYLGDYLLNKVCLQKKNIFSTFTGKKNSVDFFSSENDCFFLKKKIDMFYQKDGSKILPIIMGEIGFCYFLIFRKNINNALYSTRKGGYVVFLKKDFFLKKNLFQLPSGEKKNFDFLIFGFVGRGFFFFKKKNNLGKCSKKRPTVRGVAKNPVDHPNGGRTKVKKPFLNKKGLIAKKGK